MQAGILQKAYVNPRWNLSTKSITSKEESQKFPLSQKKRVLIRISLIRWRGVSSPSKTLLFLSRQIAQKIACGINKTLLSLTFPPQAPSQAERRFLTESETTQETPKQLKDNSHKALANRQCHSRWLGDSKSSLHIEHLFTKIIPFFCKLSHVRILPCEASPTKTDTFKGAKLFQMIFQGNRPKNLDSIAKVELERNFR